MAGKKRGNIARRSAIRIKTKDGSDIARIESTNKVLERGELLLFVSEHEGSEMSRKSLELHFNPGKICSSENGEEGRSVATLKLPINSSKTVSICPRAPYGRLGLSITGYRIFDILEMDIIIGEEGD